MRCIEMCLLVIAYWLPIWLTLTWDVLKYINGEISGIKKFGLTLTWDVLKWWRVSRISCRI